MEQSELRALEDRCIQEYPPACTTACPVHVDVRAIMAEVQRGDFSAALKILRKALPFPGIIGRVCDQPCRAACKRGEVGEPMAIAALERACADLGSRVESAGRPLPRRNKRVAVAGGGLSGLTAAFDLARKGYNVTLFEATGDLGGRLWQISDTVLPRSVLLDEVNLVKTVGVEVRLSTLIGVDLSLARVQAEFEAVYLGLGANLAELFGLELDERGGVKVDPLTFATDRPGLFAGGSLVQGDQPYSPVLSISHGRRAAISIDRYLQKVSLTASRFNEGPYTTRLYTNTLGLEARPVVPMANPATGYNPAEATQEAGRCLLCECMECVKVCEYLAHYSSYPRRYVREIYNNLSIVKGTRHSNKFINSCSLCGLCAEVCPEDLSMGAVCRQARQTMVRQNRMPPSAHEFALRDMQFSNGDHFALARHEPGAAASTYLFFPGCQLSASAPEQVEQVYTYLRQKLPGTGLMMRCCGAPAEWAGRTDLFEGALAELKEQHQALGSPRLILACSSCYQMFKAHLPGVEIISLWELLEEYGLPAGTPPLRPDPVAIHDPCTTRSEPAIQASARRIVQRLGYQVEELPLSREKTECCSYGGLMWLANPELARAVVNRRIAASPADYVTYCAMCRDFLAGQGKRTLHLLDLVFGKNNDDRAGQKGPGYSQRHENRARLKRKLLKELWGEGMDGQPGYEAIQLIISGEIQARLEKRLILVEDIQQVIDYAERTGHKFVNPETGHSLAHYRPASVTYWVEYAAQAPGFVVYNAYSHRMGVGEVLKP